MGEAQNTGISSQANDSQPAWIPAVKAIAEPLISDGVLPGLIVRVEPEAGAPEVLCLGSDWDGQPLEEGTLFPVASITKLATALAILRLADMGFLSLDDPLERFLPDAAAAVDDVTPRALLCHTSGLPEDLPHGAAPYTASLDWPTLAQAFLATPLAIRPWRLVNYSNTGYALLAVIIERLARLPYPLATKRARPISTGDRRQPGGGASPATGAHSRRLGGASGHSVGALQFPVLARAGIALRRAGYHGAGSAAARPGLCRSSRRIPARGTAARRDQRPNARPARELCRINELGAWSLGVGRRAARGKIAPRGRCTSLPWLVRPPGSKWSAGLERSGGWSRLGDPWTAHLL